jgi:hypothetical protein
VNDLVPHLPPNSIDHSFVVAMAEHLVGALGGLGAEVLLAVECINVGWQHP